MKRIVSESRKLCMFHCFLVIIHKSFKPGFHKANYDQDTDQFRVKTKRLM